VTKKVVVDMAFLIEAQSEAELPEIVLGAARFKRIDFGKCATVPRQQQQQQQQQQQPTGQGPA